MTFLADSFLIAGLNFLLHMLRRTLELETSKLKQTTINLLKTQICFCMWDRNDCLAHTGNIYIHNLATSITRFFLPQNHVSKRGLWFDQTPGTTFLPHKYVLERGLWFDHFTGLLTGSHFVQTTCHELGTLIWSNS